VRVAAPREHRRTDRAVQVLSKSSDVETNISPPGVSPLFGSERGGGKDKKNLLLHLLYLSSKGRFPTEGGRKGKREEETEGKEKGNGDLNSICRYKGICGNRQI